MAGHSKWANIKHKKSKEDAKRGKAFTKLSKEITIAARSGKDPASNPRLRSLVEKARSINMPKSNVARAIAKGSGELGGVEYYQATYEGYGPHKIAVIVETITDNKNRLVAELRHLFSSHGGRLAETGAIIWMFKKKGIITIASDHKTENLILEACIDHAIEDIKQNENQCDIFCDISELEAIKNSLVKKNIPIISSDISWIPTSRCSLNEKQKKTVLAFLEELDNHDDVKNIFANL